VRQYHRGRAFEKRVQHALEARGWFVLRSAGSKGPFDLAAWPAHSLDRVVPKFLLIQCRADGQCSPRDRARMIAAALHEGQWVGVVRQAPHFRFVVRNVRVWDTSGWHDLEEVT
jgi:hypothetical protein